MNQITRPAHIALSFGLFTFMATATSFGQQLGTPQAYPQTQAYSQQKALAPYPVTQPARQQQVNDAQQGAAPVPGGAPEQPNAQPAAAPAAAKPPLGFALNELQRQQLDVVLDAWEKQSGGISTFKCPFERWEYNMAFGPSDKDKRPLPLNKNLGELSYRKPDKGSFQITEINTFRVDPTPPGQQPSAVSKGNWVKDPNAIGEHWVCDGKSVYEYRTDQKQLVERPIPPQMQGQSIVDGPLPFLFGAEAAKLKERYWMRIGESQDEKKIWLVALPKYQEQAADFRQVDVMLNREQMMPEAMKVTMPNGDWHVYLFKIGDATVNGTFDAIKAYFEAPRTPFGWKRVIENVPVAQGPGTPLKQTR